MTGSLEARNGRGHLFTLGTAVLTADRRAVMSPGLRYRKFYRLWSTIRVDLINSSIEFFEVLRRNFLYRRPGDRLSLGENATDKSGPEWKI
jgi:hypothetical protein